MRQLLNATAYCNTNAMCLHSARHLDSRHTTQQQKKGFLLAMPGIPLSSVRFPRCSLGTTKEGLEGENRKEERETFRVISSARKNVNPQITLAQNTILLLNMSDRCIWEVVDGLKTAED